MKTLRLAFGVVALVFAFATSYAIKSSPTTHDPAIIESSPQGNVCKRITTSECDGGNQLCRLDETGPQVYDFAQDSDCAQPLKMTAN
jgi:hypothetical protein